jgi:hypothetical protein
MKMNVPIKKAEAKRIAEILMAFACGQAIETRAALSASGKVVTSWRDGRIAWSQENAKTWLKCHRVKPQPKAVK